MDVSIEKEAIRRRVWRIMDESEVSRFPKPVVGRIPNFEGAETAAKKLANLPEFKAASVVKVNPDSPQASVRRETLLSGRILVMPTPRLREGFLLLDSRDIPREALRESSTIRGAFKYGSSIGIEDLPRVDVVVAGSVAVSPNGGRIGKGGGYSEIEYGILRQLGLVGEETPVLTTVHDVQILDRLPVEEHDFSVDVIVTPKKVIRTGRKRRQPRGIIWDKVTPKMLEEMSVLKELRERKKGREKGSTV